MVDEQESTKTVLKLTLFWFAQNMVVPPLEEVFMRRIVAVVFFVFVVNQAQASQVWDIMQFQVQPGQAAAALQAFDELQSSDAGSSRTASVQFQSIYFNGISPATHAVVVLYPSRAEHERWRKSMAGSADFRKFQKAMRKVATPVAQSANSPIKGWGTLSSKDKAWSAIRLRVSNPAKLLQAMDTMLTSPEFKDFTGQVWLSAIDAGNVNHDGFASHIITIGHESFTEMEQWTDYANTTEAWSTYLRTISDVVDRVSTERVEHLRVYDHDMSIEDFQQN